MAKDETKETLLQSMTKARLGDAGVPARREEREVEPREPVEPSRDIEEGRSPEEVVERRETRPVVSEGEKPKVPKKWKLRIDDGSGEPVLKELTLQQIVEQGLLDRIITSANQLPAVQRKHQELLERTAAKEAPTKPAETKPEKKEISPVEFWNKVVSVYQPIVEEAIKQNVQNGWIEPDLIEAYPQGIRTFFTHIFYQQDLIQEARERLAPIIEWVKAEDGVRNASNVINLLNETIDALAAKSDGEKGDPIFKDLRKSEVRDNFIQWLRTEIDPKVKSLTVENMEKFWLAYNAQEILNAAKEATEKAAEPPPPKRRAASDGRGARQGGPNPPPEKESLLDRLTNMRLGPQA